MELQTPREVGIYVFYFCHDQQTISMGIDLTITVENQLIPCFCLPPDGLCQKYYPDAYLPADQRDNFAAIFSPENAVRRTLELLPAKCHPHIEEFLCRTLLPECTSRGIIPPCRSMCYKVVNSPCRELVSMLAPNLQYNARNVFDSFCRESVLYKENVIRRIWGCCPI